MIASLLLLGAIVMRDSSPPCTFDQPATLVERMADLPPGVMAAFDAMFGDDRGTAEAGAYFESTDYVQTPAPRRRFIRAYRIGEVWIIWYERGGIVLSEGMVALGPRYGDNGVVALQGVPGSNFGGDLCASSKAFLAGARSY